MKRMLATALVALALPAEGQFFDLNRIIDTGKKAIEAGQKLGDATKEYSTEEEVQLGEGLTAGFLGAAPLHRDERLQRYVNRVGRWLALHGDRPDLPWTFGVLESDTINAFSMPGGHVVISHGLLSRLQSESELAAVLAHEIAHVVKKHQLSAIQSGAWGEVGAAIGKEVVQHRVGRSGGDYLGLKSQLASAGVDLVKNGFFLRPLDRGMEHEADRVGVLIATRAGYDPYGLVAVLQLLAQAKPDEAGASIIFATHPPAADRLAELEKSMAALDRYASQPQVEGRFRQAVGLR